MATSGLLTPPPTAPGLAGPAGAPAAGLDEAAAAGLVALADRCVQCGLCLPHCPTYALDATESESPRGRIAYVRATAAGALAPTPVGDLHLDHCLGCLRCEGACPAGVEYGALLVGARAAQAAREAPPADVRRALGWLRSPRLPAALRAYRLLYPVLPHRLRPLPRPPGAAPRSIDPPTAAVALFAGCVSSVYETSSRAALARLLAAAGIATRTPPRQGCCGAAAAHAGDAAGAQALAAANRAAFQGGGAVACLASGCQRTLAGALAGVAAVEDALVLLDRHGAGLRFREASGRVVALHLPCTQSATAGSVAATRRLLARVPGLRVVDLPEAGCCGAAGTHMLAFPARAAALRAPLLEAFARSGATQLLSANIGCRLHLANALDAPVRHPLDLLGEFLVEAPPIHPDIGHIA
jgi:glycolate oxidase iron-sulfur subunit